MSDAAARPLALTLGEPAGIGPDLALTVWRRRKELGVPPFYVIGDADLLGQRARLLGIDIAIAHATPAEACRQFANALPVVPLAGKVTSRPGAPDETSAPAAIGSIDAAVADVMAGRASAVVTNPINKQVLYRAGFTDPGHTEYLARLAERATGKAAMPVMLLWSPELAVVPVTIHVALKEAVAQLSTRLIVDTGRIVARDMEKWFGLRRPRLALAGLNPHAGEDGTLGREDIEIVAPAVAALKADGIDARGPLPADTMFHAAARATYDVALGMYHDQVLVPIKTLAFEHGVNVTLGLPFLRTSPDHGTAFDIAGTGRADPSSLVAALKLAARLTARAPVAAA
ncbi:MAG: 4-hydroxythreonine-4-phosphate dehydrogenase PdxA [Pseudolabrys sp.]